MIQHYKYSLTEIESLIPFERDIYYKMLSNYLEELELEKQKANGS